MTRPMAMPEWARMPEQRVAGERSLLLHDDDEKGDQHRGHGDRERQIDAREDAERDAEERAMRQRVAEIGHAAPDDEAAERAGDGGDADAAEPGAQQELGQHQAVSRQSAAARRRIDVTGKVVVVVVMVAVDGDRIGGPGAEQCPIGRDRCPSPRACRCSRRGG